MDRPRYKTVTRTQGANRLLKDGRVVPATFDFDFEEVDPLIAAFRRMVRGLEFDICELALTTYVCAKSYGKRFTALPIFLVRGFHHGAIQVNRNGGIVTPKDLEGRGVGVNRGYTVTTGVWARSILEQEYGVDLAKVTWVLSGDEHVEEFEAPANVMPVEPGRKVADMLVSGELAAAIGFNIDHPDIVSLIPDAEEAGLAHFRADGRYPINHLIVVRDELLAERPGLARDVFDAFVRAKRGYLDALRAGTLEKLDSADRMHLRVMETSPDPLPYGIEPNRQVLEALIDSAVSQQIIKAPAPVASFFAAETRDLVG